MKESQRLDKVLSHMGFGSRSELRKLAKKGAIAVNGEVVKNSAVHVLPGQDRIEVNGEVVEYRAWIYLMMNKPQGVISATEDRYERTVIDLLAQEYVLFSPFPVGRLDKDTEGLLVLTNDGKLAHEVLSPRRQIDKTYYVEVNGYVDESDRTQLKAGVTLDDGYETMPAEITILEATALRSRVELTIQEGKFHQVKRMFKALGKEVLYLRRIQMGGLVLDPQLSLGQYRELTAEEVQLLQKNAE